jgi:ribonuclease Z
MEGMSLRGEPFDFSQTNIPIKELRTVKVSHCHGAQAISVTFTNGFKFSYSGDCRPNELFCRIGLDSDVLVHEATFDDGLEGDAKAKKHCTTGEAVGVALGMKARNLILTHFSQRYQKIPVLSSVKMPEHVSEADLLDDDDAEMTTGPELGAHDADSDPPQTSDATAWTDQDATRNLNIGVAFDLMRVKVSQIASMKRLFPAISKMFQVQEEKREAKRQAVAAVLRTEEERKMADKLARQGANRQRMAQAQAKNKQANQQKGNKRKLETEKEKDKEKEKQIGEGIPASASMNAKCAQNADAEAHGNGLGREAANSNSNSNSINSPTRLQADDDGSGPIEAQECTDKAAEYVESTTSPAKRRKLDVQSG